MNLLNIVSVISVLLLGLLMVIFTILLPVAIIFSTRSGIKYRQALAEQLDQLRLGKMLTALGIGTDRYLSRVREVDIHKQMGRCTACANTEECDTHLAEGATDADSIGYCNNEASLQKISERLKD